MPYPRGPHQICPFASHAAFVCGRCEPAVWHLLFVGLKHTVHVPHLLGTGGDGGDGGDGVGGVGGGGVGDGGGPGGVGGCPPMSFAMFSPIAFPTRPRTLR